MIPGMTSELERDFEKIRAMSTEEIRRGLAVQAWGSEARKSISPPGSG